MPTTLIYPVDYAYATTTVNASYTAGSGSLTVVSTASPFPQTRVFFISIFDQSSFNLKAMLKVTVLNSGTNWSVEADGLDANCNVGDIVVCSLTPGMIASIQGEQLIQSQVASNVATIDFTNWYLSSFSRYRLRFEKVIPVTANQHLQLQLSTDNGATWDTGTNYDWFVQQQGTGGAFNNNGGSDTSIRLVHDVNNTANFSAGGWLDLILPGDSLYKELFARAITRCSDGNTYQETCGAYYKSTSAYNGLRLKFASGNISSGNFSLYALN